jgi:hypothetical protein
MALVTHSIQHNTKANLPVEPTTVNQRPQGRMKEHNTCTAAQQQQRCSRSFIASANPRSGQQHSKQ